MKEGVIAAWLKNDPSSNDSKKSLYGAKNRRFEWHEANSAEASVGGSGRTRVPKTRFRASPADRGTRFEVSCSYSCWATMNLTWEVMAMCQIAVEQLELWFRVVKRTRLLSRN